MKKRRMQRNKEFAFFSKPSNVKDFVFLFNF